MRLLGLSLLCLLSGLSAQAARLLPASAGPWNTGQVQQVTPEALESLSASTAPILREYGILVAERAVYESGGQHLTVTLYRMRDSSAAYGAYTFLRTPDMAVFDLADKSAVGRERALVVEGNLLLAVEYPGDLERSNGIARLGVASLAGLKALVAKIAPAAERAAYPSIREYLPAQGLLPNSDHYLLGPTALERLLPRANLRASREPNNAPALDSSLGIDWIGFGDGAEAELALYQIHDEPVCLLLVQYPTRQMATKHLEALGKLFVVNPLSDAAPIRAGSKPGLFVVRKMAMLAIVAGTRSPAVASSLIREVQYETQITWSEPSWKATEKPFVLLLYDVFVGTGVILTYSIVASLAFGLLRLTIKRMLPNQVFDRPSQMEVLQIGIYSKPIQAKDFYSDDPED